ncbi:hypothetical protein SUGI_0991640 [Cryptomeria japonica]|nr:hypothetical protein SUGI_0991640 [Cryptomeria japonica]
MPETNGFVPVSTRGFCMELLAQIWRVQRREGNRSNIYFCVCKILNASQNFVLKPLVWGSWKASPSRSQPSVAGHVSLCRGFAA